MDFAKLLHQGKVLGIDTSTTAIDRAMELAAERGLKNVEFRVADIFDTKHALNEDSFDVVHAHQVLQHVPNPVEMMREMRRVSKDIVAVRETDFSSAAWYPILPGMEEFRQLWIKINKARGLDPDMGRRLLSIALEAGFKRTQIISTAGTWCYSTAEETEWWSSLWAERIVQSDFAKNAVEGGFADRQDLERMANACQEWGKAEDAWFVFPNGEVICRKHYST